MRTAVRGMAVALTVLCAAACLAACGRSSSNASSGGNTSTSASGGATSTAAAANAASTDSESVDTSNCPSSSNTQGVSSSTIKIGQSLPESGAFAAFIQAKYGEQAYFDQLNAKGGIDGHKIELTAIDDGYQPQKTATNVQEMLQQDGVFGFMGLLGTPNNLAVAGSLDQQCVPNLLAFTASPAVAAHPFTTLGLQSSAVEPAVALTQIAKAVPNAKIGILYQDDDLGQGYLTAWKNTLAKDLVPGSGAKIVAQESFQVTATTLASQVTAAVGKGANVIYLAGAGGAQCVQTIDAAAPQVKEVWLPTGCGISQVDALAKPASNVYVAYPYVDATSQRFAKLPAVKLFTASLKKYEPKGDPSQLTTEQGWTLAAILAAILKKSPSLTRTAVINTAHDITVKDPGLLYPGVSYSISPKSPFGLEDYVVHHWDPSTKQLIPQGGVITKFAGMSVTLSK